MLEDAGVDLFWLPLGAGGRVVRWNGKAYEAMAAAVHGRPRTDLFHSALEVSLPQGWWVVEMTPVRAAGDELDRGGLSPRERSGPLGQEGPGGSATRSTAATVVSSPTSVRPLPVRSASAPTSVSAGVCWLCCRECLRRSGALGDALGAGQLGRPGRAYRSWSPLLSRRPGGNAATWAVTAPIGGLLVTVLLVLARMLHQAEGPAGVHAPPGWADGRAKSRPRTDQPRRIRLTT